MIIELSNGLDHLFQWDTGQKVKVPENVPTVHFKWGNDAVSFDVVDGWVEIPPELTQKAGYILLWTYREDHTLDAARIPVERRPKPDGYAYTPTEIKTWESLDGRITALEAANVQPNWNQNDDSAADYVRGRTHYVGSKHDVRIINQYAGHFEPELGLVIGNSYRVWYDTGRGFGGDTAAKEFVCQTLIAGDGGVPNPYVGKPYVGNADTDGGPNPYLIFDNYILLHTGFSHAANPIRWKIEGDFAAVKTLDLKYIDPKLLERIKALEDGAPSAGDLSLGLTGVTVGQTVKISAVDVNGVPTAWEPVEMAQEILSGTTNDLTPAQVYAAVSAGRPVKIQYTSDDYGISSYTAFNISETMGAIASQNIFYYFGVYMLAELCGNIKSGEWFFNSTLLAEKKDIPTVPSSLKNPKALTIKIGSNTVTYDGSIAQTVDMESGSSETWELINEVTLSEDAMAVVFDKDKSGAAFALRKFAVVGTTKGSNASNTGGGVICINVANTADDRYSIVPPVAGHGALKGDQIRYWHAVAESFGEKGWRWYLTGADNTWKTNQVNIGTTLMSPLQTIQKVATYLALWSRTSGSAFAAGSKIELYGVRA